MPITARDPHSLANPHEIAVRHLDLDLTVDFDARQLHGRATLDVERKIAAAMQLVLDTQALTIEAVTSADGTRLPFQLGSADSLLGRPLTIDLPPNVTQVSVRYRTAPDAAALLWLPPEGTPSGRAPMLFSQSESIYARSWVPLQDSPAVRFTYDATLRVPKDLLAVMSAENPQQRRPDGVYRFHLGRPIPSYLLAIAVGDIAFRAIGPRTGVYADPRVVEIAAAEFDEVEAMIDAAEGLYGPYRWGRYDLLVLPPSFPYGGMENPRLTFVTPTVIVGDKSLVSLIAHELAHSWSGNLVTNASWNDFWLNEGLTVYVERRIMEALRGADYAAMLAVTGRRDLDEALAKAGPEDPNTRLCTEWGAQQSPDDGIVDVPYEKGSLLLLALEQAVGRAAFDRFLRARFDRLAFQSTDSAAFERDIVAELFHGDAAAAERFGLHEWIYGTGLPVTAPRVISTRFAALERLAPRLAADPTGTLFDTTNWTTLEWVELIRALPTPLSLSSVTALDRRYGFSRSRNREIQLYWLPLAIAADDRRAVPAVEEFLSTVGRRRMVRPLFTAMIERGGFWRETARRIFSSSSKGYHPLTRAAIAQLFERS